MAAISVQEVTKHFGDVCAVQDLSFEVEAGTVTGFLGPNGAGKTTTLRMLLGLVHPTSGQALVDGVPYHRLGKPAFTVGAALESTGFHPGRTARDHLRVLARPNGIPTSRVDTVLEEVDLARSARRRVGGFSLGMKQRLGLAAALLGDPAVLVLDEPANGLDPAGVHWLRALLRERADAGAAVLVSSHQLAELALSADDVVIIQDGRLVTRGSVDELTRGQEDGVRVTTPHVEELRVALAARGITAETRGEQELLVREATPQQVGQAVAAAGLVIYELAVVHRDLEAVFLELTDHGQDHGS